MSCEGGGVSKEREREGKTKEMVILSEEEVRKGKESGRVEETETEEERVEGK